MDNMNLDEKIKAIADHYGIESQLLKLDEECSELAAVHCKESYELAYGGNPKVLKRLSKRRVSETADVLILASQILYLVSLPDNRGLAKSIGKAMKKKIKRQLRRIEEEQNAENQTN